jgi:hypothetical protein
VKVLFFVLAPITLKNFDSVVRELARRGHQVTIALQTGNHAPGTEELIERLRRDVPSVRFDVPPAPVEPWLDFSADVRSNLDLVMYLDDRFTKAYRSRSWKRSALFVRRVVRSRFGRSRLVHRLLTRVLLVIESSVPTSEALAEYLRSQAPDVVLFSPYVALRTQQPDYLRAAQALGLRTAVAVFSWDNLSSKSRLSPLPDRVLVWNETQRREAETLHRVPSERVVVTGAQNFDEWFDWQPRPREEFCASLGLDPARPFALYGCFTPFKGTGSEVPFVLRWIERIRSADDPDLRTVGIVVRPHPKRIGDWRGVDLDQYADTALWPRDGRLPTDEAAKADLFDSIYHSGAVVGLNTSLLIEAAIVGRPVLTILAPEHARSQVETLHFRYLLEVGGGILDVAADLDQHMVQLAAALRSGPRASERFLRAFVRPYGLEQAATPRFVDALEELASTPAPAPVRPTVAARAIRPVLAPMRRRSAREADRLRRDRVARQRLGA